MMYARPVSWSEWSAHVADPAIRRQLDEVLRERRQAKRYKNLANAVPYDSAKPGTAWHRWVKRQKDSFNRSARVHAGRAKRLRDALGGPSPKVKKVPLPSCRDQRIARQYNPEATDCMPSVRKWLAVDSTRNELRKLLAARTTDTRWSQPIPADGDNPAEVVIAVVPAWSDEAKRDAIREAIDAYRTAKRDAESIPQQQPERLAA